MPASPVEAVSGALVRVSLPIPPFWLAFNQIGHLNGDFTKAVGYLNVSVRPSTPRQR